MEALAIYPGQQLAPAQEITTALFNDFVAFVDRSKKTTRTYLTNLRQFMAWLKYEQIPQPREQDIKQYRDWLQTEHDSITFEPATATGWAYRIDHSGSPERICCKPATVRAYLQSVKQFFSWTEARNIYPNIAKNIHAPAVSSSHKKDSFTAPQVAAIESSIAGNEEQRTEEQNRRLYAIFLLATNTGLRTIEISRARIKDLETKDGQAWLYIWGKGRNEPDQKKPIVAEVKAAIDAYLQTRTDHPTANSPLFVATGNRSHGKPIAATTISTMLKGAMKAAGFDSARLTAHSCRHTAAQNVVDMTGNIYKAQLYLRHSSPATTERYLENDSSKQDVAIAKQLWQRYHGEAPETGLDRLMEIAATMNPEQLAALTTIAQNMRR